MAAATSSSRSIRSFSIASLWRRAVSIAAAAWLANSASRRASVGVKSSTRPSRDSLSATARAPSRRPGTEMATARIFSQPASFIPAVGTEAAALLMTPAFRDAGSASRGEDLAPDVALESTRPTPREHERALAGVGQRDRTEQDLVGQGAQVELPSERQPQVVERLELEQPRLQLELRVADLAREVVRGHDRAEQKPEQTPTPAYPARRPPERAGGPREFPFGRSGSQSPSSCDGRRARLGSSRDTLQGRRPFARANPAPPSHADTGSRRVRPSTAGGPRVAPPATALRNCGPPSRAPLRNRRASRGRSEVRRT